MNLNSVGFYFLKNSTNNNKKEIKWIKANLEISAQVNKYTLEINPIIDDDIYDEDEEDKFQKMPRSIKLIDYKHCEQRGSQKLNNIIHYVIALVPKLFTKAKKLYLAYNDAELQNYWLRNLEPILTHKFHRASSMLVSCPNDQSSSPPLDKFMIENDVYEGSLMPGEFYATVLDNAKSKEISIKGKYILSVTDIGIELKVEYNKNVVKFWEIKSMRRFGENENVFFLELGKYCVDGEGVLSFKVDRGKQLIKELVKTKDNFNKTKSISKSRSFKENEDVMFNSFDDNEDMKIAKELSNSINMSIHENTTYGLQVDNKNNSPNSLNVRSNFEGPPKQPPPPIPKDNISGI